jgi:hypothetical protein
MAVKYASNFIAKNSKIYQNWDFLVWKLTIWQPWYGTVRFYVHMYVESVLEQFSEYQWILKLPILLSLLVKLPRFKSLQICLPVSFYVGRYILRQTDAHSTYTKQCKCFRNIYFVSRYIIIEDDNLVSYVTPYDLGKILAKRSRF